MDDKNNLLAQAQEIQKQKLLAQAQSIQSSKLAPQNPAAQAPGDEGAAAAGLQGFGQGGTLGYLPQAQAAFGHGVEKLNELVGGDEATPYEDLRNYFQKRNAQLSSDHPIATGAGNIAGAVMTLPVGGAAKGAPLLAKVGRAALVGGAYGGLSNPGDTPDAGPMDRMMDDPYAEMKKRLTNAGYGAALGGAAEGIIGAPSALASSGKSVADRAVVKQIGANAGQIKKILQKAELSKDGQVIRKNELSKIGDFLDQEGLMSSGKGIEDVADKTAQILKEDGPKIGNLYDQAQNFAQAAEGGSVPIKRIDGNALADQIIAQAKDKVKNHPDRNLVGKTIEDAVAPLRDMGDNANIVDLHDFRKGLDENINWGQKAQERDAVQRALVDARNLVTDHTKDAIDSLDGVIGGKMLDRLKDLNARYSSASTVNNIATQAQGREMAKALMGHGIIGGGIGLGAGALTYEHTHDPVKSIGLGILAGLGTTAARKYGAPLGYYGGRALESAAPAAEAMTPSPGVVGAGSVVPWMLMNKGNNNGR